LSSKDSYGGSEGSFEFEGQAEMENSSSRSYNSGSSSGSERDIKNGKEFFRFHTNIKTDDDLSLLEDSKPFHN
jgi:hypothetical protein